MLYFKDFDCKREKTDKFSFFLLNEYLKKNFTFVQFFQLTTNLPTYLQSLEDYKRPLLI